MSINSMNSNNIADCSKCQYVTEDVTCVSNDVLVCMIVTFTNMNAANVVTRLTMEHLPAFNDTSTSLQRIFE
jgi:hypothetical protein